MGDVWYNWDPSRGIESLGKRKRDKEQGSRQGEGIPGIYHHHAILVCVLYSHYFILTCYTRDGEKETYNIHPSHSHCSNIKELNDLASLWFFLLHSLTQSSSLHSLSVHRARDFVILSGMPTSSFQVSESYLFSPWNCIVCSYDGPYGTGWKDWIFPPRRHLFYPIIIHFFLSFSPFVFCRLWLADGEEEMVRKVTWKTIDLVKYPPSAYPLSRRPFIHPASNIRLHIISASLEKSDFPYIFSIRINPDL